MDDQGVDVAVLSLASPGGQNLPAADAVSVARDALAEIVAGNRTGSRRSPPSRPRRRRPPWRSWSGRFTRLGFRGAMLYGRTGDKLADAPEFDDLYAAAARLRVPLHFPPQTPMQSVLDAYYSGLGAAGLGWYHDLGGQYLRMILSGVFDRHPDLQVMVARNW